MLSLRFTKAKENFFSIKKNQFGNQFRLRLCWWNFLTFTSTRLSPRWANPTSYPFIKYSKHPGAQPDAPPPPPTSIHPAQCPPLLSPSRAGSQLTGHVAHWGVQRLVDGFNELAAAPKHRDVKHAGWQRKNLVYGWMATQYTHILIFFGGLWNKYCIYGLANRSNCHPVVSRRTVLKVVVFNVE